MSGGFHPVKRLWESSGKRLSKGKISEDFCLTIDIMLMVAISPHVSCLLYPRTRVLSTQYTDRVCMWKINGKTEG